MPYLESEIDAVRRIGHLPYRTRIPHLRHTNHRTSYSEESRQEARDADGQSVGGGWGIKHIRGHVGGTSEKDTLARHRP